VAQGREPAAHEAQTENHEVRRGALVGFRVAVLVYGIFGLVDHAFRWLVFPQASWIWLVGWRLVGLIAILAGWLMVVRKQLSARATVALVGYSFSASVFAVAMIARDLGGIGSVYAQGLAFYFAGVAAILPGPWPRMLALCVPGFVTYFGTISGIIALDPVRKVQWQTGPQVAAFASNMLFAAGLCAFAVASGHLLWASRKQLYEARRLGRYRLKGRIGKGGMNEIWLAWDDTLRRDVALKLLRMSAEHDQGRWQRFEREAHSTSMLCSPHTVRIFDYGASEDGIAYIAMEYLSGQDAEQLVQQNGPLDVRRVVHLARQVCVSLAEAHQRGLVHRDAKPANLFVSSVPGEEDFLKVLDFGVARQLDLPRSAALTVSGAFVGTPAYMAPEAFKGEVDARSDVYSVGATLYFLLTGRPPFEGNDEEFLREAHARHPVSPPSRLRRATVPPELETLVLRCLAKSPAERYADGAALGAALASLSDVAPWTTDEARRFWAAVRFREGRAG
jgi:serine/threonine-protein kinase